MGNSRYIHIESKYILFLLFLFLWITASSYCKISRDFENYTNWCLLSSQSVEVAFERDPLFGTSCIAAGFITADPIALVAPLWIFAALLLKFFALRSENKIFLWSLLTYLAFFFIAQEITQIRAAVASAALGYAFVQIINKQYIKSIILCLVAVTAHLSSLLLVPILLFLPILIKTKSRFVTTVLTCQLVFLLSILLPELQNSLIAILSNFRGLDERVTKYLYNYEIVEITALHKNVKVGFFMIISIFILVKAAVTDQYNSNNSNKLIYGATCMTSIAIVVLALSYTVPSISLRSFDLFAVPMSIMVGTYIQSIEEKDYAYIVNLIIFLILAGSFYKSTALLIPD